MKRLSTHAVITLFVLTCLFRFIQMYVFPVTQDEAYYFYWARFLDFGYFDHPPFIAWLGSLIQFAPSSVFVARLLGGILTCLMFPVILSLAKISGLKDKASIISALALTQLNLAGLLLGFIQTPDLPLAAFWLLAIHEAAYALKEDPKRWISAGIMTGLGLSSKYTMAIIGLSLIHI